MLLVVFNFKIGDEDDYDIDPAENNPCYVNAAIILVITIMVFTVLMVTVDSDYDNDVQRLEGHVYEDNGFNENEENNDEQLKHLLACVY